MEKQNLKRIITAGLITAGILSTAPVSAKAVCNPNTTNMLYTKGSSLVLFWAVINENLQHIQDNTTNLSEVVEDYSYNNNIFDKNIEQAVSDAIKNRNGKAYYMGEVATEGHIILAVEEKGTIVKAYTISSFGYFGFENGIFTIISGSGAIPTVITFSKDANDEYSLLEYKEPIDGDGCSDSIKEMFPKNLWNKVLYRTDLTYSNLVESQKAQAEEYLKRIGRNAEINPRYVERNLPNIDVSASNKLLEEISKDDYFLNNCPYWLGSKEKLENGARIIYETSQSKSIDGYDMITFKKSKADGTAIEERCYKIIGSEPKLQ